MTLQGTKHNIEYGLVRLFAALFCLLGPRWGLSVARGIGWLAFRLDRRHRRIALENLRHAFGDGLTDKDRRRIVLGAFQNLAMNAAEFCTFHRVVRPENLGDFVQFRNERLLTDALAEGRGAMLVTGHIGNWEIGGNAVSMRFAPCHSIARALKNPKVDRWVNEIRQKTGQRIIPKDGALRSMVSLLREGKLLAFLLDQHAGDKGIPVDFFGRKAYTFDSVAALSKRFNVPVICGFDRRIGNRFKHEMRAVERIDPGNASVEELTARYTKFIEDTVRETPEAWLWMHRRWKESKPRPRSAARENGAPDTDQPPGRPSDASKA
jgi:KDO2-lipid IV(A) lauroyltransferase